MYVTFIWGELGFAWISMAATTKAGYFLLSSSWLHFNLVM